MDRKILEIDELQAWEGVADCSACTLRHSVLFAGLEETDFARLHRPVEQFELQTGELLYAAGDS
ncbi:MAG TPA: hypothetical protein ENJ64_07255, partial [Thiotrichales bacterium]|nr:hypothetical protein [Thiotrichales bacterium]